MSLHISREWPRSRRNLKSNAEFNQATQKKNY